MIGGTERRACEFQLLRYVPNAVRNECVHIGVILREAAGADKTGKAGSGEVEPGKVESGSKSALRATGGGCAASIPMPTRSC
jgi:hypothetical protein